MEKISVRCCPCFLISAWTSRIFRFRFAEDLFIRRVLVERLLTDDELSRIPEKNRPIGPVIRSEVRIIDMPPFNRVNNRVEVIFDGAEPESADQLNALSLLSV